MTVKVLGVPTDFGANRRGVDMGASALRYANLLTELRQLDLEVEDLGDLNISVIRDKIDDDNFLAPVLDICRQLADRVEEIVSKQDVPLILGGDHSIAIGNLAGVSRRKEVGVIWFDAHGDFNNFITSPTGNIHGMVLAAVVGQGDDRLNNCCQFIPKAAPEQTVIVGARALDPPEQELLKKSGVTVFTIEDIDKVGMHEIMKQAITISSQGVEGVHVSLDLDVVDPLEAPGVGTPVKGGLDYREAHLAMEMIAEAEILSSAGVVEINPILDYQNQTAQLAVELIKSLLGEKIL